MMELPKNIDPETIENKWYTYWLQQKFFKSTPDEREPYTVVIPPPNVTGVLHMGHMLNNTIQDVLVRRARMQGKNACWVPGTDHASIATEAKVVQKLKAEGIEKSSLSREEFLKHAWEWKEKHGGIILEQLKKLGASCDWDRTRFTMDPDLTDAVLDVFIDLYQKGYVYRGVRMINWDPRAKTALSDEEVIYKEVDSELYYVNYKIENTDKFITIATTRPETILGDTAICVHPADERYKHLIGKTAIVPIVNRPVKIIADEYVDQAFGTGALKITPAHDLNDYELGIKHNLEVIDILNDDGTLSPKATVFVGQDRFVVRKKIAQELEKIGLLVKTEKIKNKVGFSERTNEVIEPKLSLQWFCKMQALAKPALENVMNDNIKFYPAKFKNTYKHWMENVKDWCISRQLWWGQQIPAWYHPSGKYAVAKTAEQAAQILIQQGINCRPEELKQDEDVLDTWFSSWLWPISVFDGFKDKNNKDIQYYYPTNDLVTAPEILFFWVARMIMAGYEYMGDKPFKNVYLTGIVRDKQGRKMSKSLGNSPDPIELMKKYGADGVRVGMLLCSPAGNDLLFDEALCEQGRNFSNKIWNAFRLVQSWEIQENTNNDNQVAINWFEAKLNKTIAEIEEYYDKFRLSDVLMTIYKLTWDDFCSWYLEMIKPGFQQPIDQKTYDQTIVFFETLLKILHPFMPFLTEEIWQTIKKRQVTESLVIASYPQITKFDDKNLKLGETVKELVSTIRNIRKESNLPLKESIDLHIKTSSQADYSAAQNIIKKLANVANIHFVNQFEGDGKSFVILPDEFFVPITLDKAKERQKLEEELLYTQGFLESVMKKLNNEKFITNASQQVIENERKKQQDAETKIELIKQKLAML